MKKNSKEMSELNKCYLLLNKLKETSENKK